MLCKSGVKGNGTETGENLRASFEAEGRATSRTFEQRARSAREGSSAASAPGYGQRTRLLTQCV